MRIGTGYDLHRLVEGRALLLGGVTIPSPKGEEAHSDGDVLIHAIIDALLGAAAAGDIGSHFPPTEEEWKGIPSCLLLRKTASLIYSLNYVIVNIDTTVVLETPCLRPFIEAIRLSLSGELALSPDQISIKGKSKEGVDTVGRGEALEAFASVLLQET